MNDKAHSSLLYLDGVTVSFDGFKALNELSLIIEPGEMRAIIGPNGAGKTTMMDVVTGKTRPDSGDIYFDGTVDLTRLDEAAIATLGIGRKFQKPTVFESHTVWDNLDLALAGSRAPGAALFRPAPPSAAERIEEILGIIRLAERRDVLAAFLSHGQKQWLEIGMLLAQEPKLLLVDEPAAGMTDAETEDHRRAPARDRHGEVGDRGRARHGFRARARRQGDGAARRRGASRRARSTRCRPIRASSRCIWGDEDEARKGNRQSAVGNRKWSDCPLPTADSGSEGAMPC